MKTKVLVALILCLISLKHSNAQFSASSFATKVDFTTYNNAQGITSGDLNNDSKPELLTANISPGNSIGIYLNASTTGVINSSLYSSNFTLTTLSAQPINLKTIDINGDNKQDIVVTYASSTNTYFSIFVNLYNGTTLNSSSFARYDFLTGTNPQGAAFGDFDLDGKIDIAISNYGSNTIGVYKNNSTIGALSLSSPVSYSAGSGPSALTAGDIDNDGKSDIVSSNWTGNSITILRNTNSTVGTMSFTSVSIGNNIATGANPNWVTLSDFNNNGLKEILVANYYSNSVSVFENVTTSGITLATRFDLSISPYLYTQALSAIDLDGDSKQDLAVTMAGSPAAVVFKNVHTSGLLSPSSFSGYVSYTTGSGPCGFNSNDLDGDMRPELLVGNYTSQTVSILKNRMLASEPSIQATIVSNSISVGSATLNLGKGNGNKRMVVARLNSSSLVTPSDSLWYTAKDTFGIGSLVGLGNYVVYNDTGSMVTIKGLALGQTYTFSVYEYNGYGGFSNYNLTSPPTSTINLGDVFYSKSSGALNLLSTWGPNTDGTGTAPLSFNNANTIYVVTNNPAPTISANWIVSGTNSYTVIGDGINALNLSIPSGNTIFADSISIRSNATITFSGGLISNKVYFDSLSTAQFTSTSAQNIPGFTYYNLIAANSTKTITNNCTIRNSLNLLSNVNTGIYTLTLGTSTTQVGSLNRNSNGTISGRFKRWFAASTNTGNTGLFPMLVGTNYRPATVEFTSAPSSGGTLTSEFFSTPPGNTGLLLYDFSVGFVEVNKASVNGFWKIDPIGVTGGTYTLTLTGTGFYGINTVADLRLIKRQTSGAWTLQGTAILGTGTTATPVVGRSGYSGFGEFTIGGDSTVNPLPVSWLSFEGTLLNDVASLSWRTASESNNSHFVVERKIDSKGNFEERGVLKANNSKSVSTYTFNDANTDGIGLLIYRIKQVDFDGNYSYSKELSLENTTENTSEFFPNPSNNKIYFKNLSLTTISVIDFKGLETKVTIESNSLDISNFNRGIYILKSENGTLGRLIIE
ncbi:MAG: hypothetical protein CFE21_16930 [Bacteroidetes bacterium B1(2017)]|nr:MAG: hypothetical protein CFE21_16930 [Bacteroidetes bacterium B1(2017)]